MIFRANSSDVKRPFSRVKPVARRTQISQTEAMFIRAKEGVVVLEATDYTTSIKCMFDADVDQEGEVLVDAARMIQILSAMPTGVITFVLEGNVLQISGGSASFSLVAHKADNFPLLEDRGNLKWTNVDGGKFKQMIQRTIIVNGVSENAKPHINGMLLKPVVNGTQRLQLVSTDGQRLNMASCTVDDGSPMPQIDEKSLIPKSGLDAVLKFIDKDGVQIAFSGPMFFIKNTKSGEIMGIRMLSGDYPDFDGLVNPGPEKSVEIDMQAFASLAKRMSILATAEHKILTMEVLPSSLVATLDNPDMGKACETASITYSGEPITLHLNPMFLLDALSVMSSSTVSMRIDADNRPVQFCDTTDETLKALVMPMRG